MVDETFAMGLSLLSLMRLVDTWVHLYRLALEHPA